MITHNARKQFIETIKTLGKYLIRNAGNRVTCQRVVLVLFLIG